MDNATYHQIIRAVFFTLTDNGWGAPTLFEAKPGVGKSKRAVQAAQAWGMDCEVFSFAERGEAAAGVMPAVDHDLGVVSYAQPDWAARLASKPRTVLFLDEITVDSPELRAAALGMALDKRVGGHSLGRGCRVLAACNPEGMGGVNTRDLDPAAANRFVHVQADVPAADVLAYWAARDLTAPVPYAVEAQDAAAEESRVLAAWPAAYARNVAILGAFLRTQGELLHAMPADTDPQASRAWPSPRSWDMALCLLTSCDIQGTPAQVRDLLIAGCVGDVAAASFGHYLANLDLPDAAAVLDGATQWAHNPARPDLTWAVLGSCAGLVAAADCDNRAARAAALGGLCAQTMAAGPDLILDALVTVRRGAQQGHYPATMISQGPWAKVLQRMAPAMRAAGLVD